MKRIITLGILLLSLAPLAHAATRKDVRILEASDSIRYNASKLAKAYLLYLHYPQKRSLHGLLQTPLDDLSDAMHTIATSTRDPRTKGVLKYFAYEKVHMDNLIGQKPSQKGAADVLDFSDGFTEGAAAIAHRHQYTPSPEEAMWILTRTMKEDIEAILEYYLAQSAIKTDPQLRKKMDKIIANFEAALRQVNDYHYDAKLTKVRDKIKALWHVLRSYLDKEAAVSLPMISTLMGDDLEASLEQLSQFHNANQ